MKVRKVKTELLSTQKNGHTADLPLWKAGFIVRLSSFKARPPHLKAYYKVDFLFFLHFAHVYVH